MPTIRQGAVIASLAALAGCAAPSPAGSPLAIAYQWPSGGAYSNFGNGRPPVEITIHFDPSLVSRGAVAAIAQSTCLAWNHRPSPLHQGEGVARFRCDRPLVEAKEAGSVTRLEIRPSSDQSAAR